MNKERIQLLEKTHKIKFNEARNKFELREHFTVSIPKDQIKERVITFDKPKLVEANGRQFKARGIIKSADVTRYTENDNYRIYPFPLWKQVESNGSAEGTLCLGDHPPDDDDGSFWNVIGVWHDFCALEKTGKGDLYCVGEGGALLLEILEAGGEMGFSSVAYGTFLEDNKTLDKDTFELVRLGDAVLFPSQRVYAGHENVMRTVEPTLEQKIKDNANLLEESDTNKTSLDAGGQEQMSEILQEKTYRNYIKTTIKEALKNTNLIEAQESLTEAIADIPDDGKFAPEKAKAESALSAINEKLASRIETADSVQDLESKLELSEQVAAELKTKLKQAEEVIESMQVDEKKKKEMDGEEDPEDPKAKEEGKKKEKDGEDKEPDPEDPKEGDEKEMEKKKKEAKSDSEVEAIVSRLLDENKKKDAIIKTFERNEKTMTRDLDKYEESLVDAENKISELTGKKTILVTRKVEGSKRVSRDSKRPARKVQRERTQVKPTRPVREKRQPEQKREAKSVFEQPSLLEEQAPKIKSESGFSIDVDDLAPKKVARKSEKSSRSTRGLNDALDRVYEEEVQKNPAIADIEAVIKESKSVAEAYGKITNFTSKESGDFLKKESGVSGDKWYEGIPAMTR